MGICMITAANDNLNHAERFALLLKQAIATPVKHSTRAKESQRSSQEKPN